MNGASGWTRKQKREFANDPENLLPVDKKANRQKGAKGPSRWMPPNKDYHCKYISKWKSIKSKYGLKSGPQELRKLEKIEGACR